MNRWISKSWLTLVCVVSVLAALISFPSQAISGETEAVLVKIQGTVLVQIAGEGKWTAAYKWMKIPLKSRIKTLSEASADILLNGRALIRIKDETELAIDLLEEKIAKLLRQKSFERIKGRGGKGTSLRLFKGKVFVLLSPNFKPLPLVVDTPIGMAGVAGTRFVVDLTQPDKCLVAVWEGKVLFWNNKEFPGNVVLVEPGKISSLKPAASPSIPCPIPTERKKMYREIKELHLWHTLEGESREPGSRYRGKFSRGYAPSTMEMGDMGSHTKETMSHGSCETGMDTSSTGMSSSGMSTTMEGSSSSPRSTSTNTRMTKDRMK